MTTEPIKLLENRITIGLFLIIFDYNNYYFLFHAAVKTQLVGCFKDDDDRALPLLLGYFKSVEKCAAAAEARRYSIFAVQNKEQCWSGPDAMETYDKHGKATNCKDGKGGEDANSVYFVTSKYGQ